MKANGSGKQANQQQKNHYRINLKKLMLRLLIIACVIIVIISVFELLKDSPIIATMGFETNASSRPTQSQANQTKTSQSAAPAKSFKPTGITIVVDAGHGGFDPGTFGVKTNVPEMDINLAIALRLQKALEKKGFTVIMTRKDENAIATTKDADMQRRADIIGGEDVDLAVSIHQNWYENSSAKGPQVFYYPGSTQGEALAKLIQSSLNNDLSIDQPRDAIAANYLVLRAGNAPAVTVECGFLSNPEDERSLQDTDYQQTVTDSIVTGIMQFLSK